MIPIDIPAKELTFIAAASDSKGRVVVRLTAEGQAVLSMIDPALDPNGILTEWCITEDTVRCFAEALALLFPPERPARRRKV